MANRGILIAVLLAAFIASGSVIGADGSQALPALHARVTDLTAALTPADKTALETKLAALEARKGAQIAVLILPTTAPESIEQYATRLFEAWKLGRKDVNDGVLIVVAKDDHRVRIEVAYGLEGAIPDAAAFRIAHEYMTPKFRAGDFAGGIGAGIDMLTRLIDEEALPPPQAQKAHHTPIPEPWWSPVQFIVGLLFGAVFGIFVVLILSRRRVHAFVLGRVPERARTFAIGAMTAVPITLLMRHPMAALGALAAGSSLSAITGLSKPPSASRRFRGGGSGGGGGWSSGGGSSDSGSSSSGSSGSDFSGGGGSSGGGGASDSW